MTVVLTHTDMDGAASGALAKIQFKAKTVVQSNYNQIMDKMVLLATEYPNADLVITDLNVLPAELQYALKAFNKVTIFDHHESTSKFIGLDKINKKFELHYNGECSATTLVYAYMNQRGHKFSDIEQRFYRYINLYDVWHHTNKDFKYGRMLNDLFWRDHWTKFHKRILRNEFYDIPEGLSHEDLVYCKKCFDDVKHAGQTAEWFNTMAGSTIVMLTPDQKSAMNHIKDYIHSHTGIYYAVYFGYGFKCSMRVGDDHLDEYKMSEWLDEYAKKDERVSNAGGHDNAGGISFEKKLELPDVLKSIEEFDNGIFEGESCIGTGTQ